MKPKILTILLILVGVIGLFTGYKLLELNIPIGNDFDKCITVITTINEDITSEEYCTNTEFLGELVDEYNDDFSPVFTGEKTNSFGRLLVELNGYKLVGNEFFFIYVDEVYGSYGIDQQPLNDGVTYELRLDTY